MRNTETIKNAITIKYEYKNGELIFALEPIESVKRTLNNPRNVNTKEWTVKIMLNAMLFFFVSFPSPIR